jgi:Zn-dependent protease with chaperone function
MNFFSEQDEARRNTKMLVGLFLLAVVILIGISNVLVAVTFWVVDGQFKDYLSATDGLINDIQKPTRQYFSWGNFGKISLLVCSVVAGAMWFKWLQLRAGGRRVAEALGGVRINPSTEDKELRRVLNVVEEMALASGMPVPCVYLLKGEKGINAFAAGYTPADAVIGITQGALEQFNREQLQGVIAHEFSHILNGDMRLNLNMVALLHGILFIGAIGEFLMRSGGHHPGRRGGDLRVFLLGLALLVVGWLGVFFGELIKAAVSRQREFLADASAVQFTRHPQGIADALKIMGGYNGGSRVYSAKAREASHMFIGQALGSLIRFDTHPPLLQRIKRIEPSWDGQFIARDMKIVAPCVASKTHTESTKPDKLQALQDVVVVAGAGVAADPCMDSALPQQAQRISIDELPTILREQAKDPFGACALVYALLLSENNNIQVKQLEYIKHSGVAGLALQTLDCSPEIVRLDKASRLPLLELVMPALKSMSSMQYKQFKKVLLLLIRADAKFEMFEWCLYQLVRHYLLPEFEREKPSRSIYKKTEQVAEAFRLVLSMLAYVGHQDDQRSVERAFGRGANAAGLYNTEPLALENCLLDDFVKAVDKLANCYPLLKPRLLKGLVLCAEFDGVVTAEEQEILTAIAAVIDCPMPRLLDELHS